MGSRVVKSHDTTFEELLELARAGSEAAWEGIYAKLSAQVAGYLRSRGAQDPDDLTADVFLQVARNIHRFRGDEAKFRSWVFVIAHRRLIDARRSSAARPATEFVVDDVSNLPMGGDVEHEAMEQLAVTRMREIFSLLTEDQQQVLGLRIIADLSIEQTAQVLGKRPGAIKALQRRGLTAVKQHLEKGKVEL